jgi:tetratricopeptide (TPR) repeat protein
MSADADSVYGSEKVPVVGTLPYMAPEHLQAACAKTAGAAADPIDARWDLFGLSVILFELLAGKHPFGPIPDKVSPREFYEWMPKRQAAGPRSLRRLNPAVSRRLAGVIEGCLAFNPRRRPQSAEALAEALRRCRPPLRQISPRPRRRVALLLIGLFLLLLGTALYELVQPTRPRYSLEQGLEYYLRGDYEQAIQHLGHVLEADPDNDQAWFVRGRAYQKRGDHNQAQLNYERVKELVNQGPAQAGRGYCAALQGSYYCANNAFDQAIRAGFVTPELLTDRGYCLQKVGQVQEARKNLDEAIKRSPHSPPAYHNRALVDLKQALADPRRNLSSATDDIDAAIRHTTESGARVSAVLYQSAACIYAVAARTDPALRKPALGYLEKALDAGLDPKTITNDPLLVTLRPLPAFQDLIMRSPVPPLPAGQIHLIDPLPDTLPAKPVERP